MNVKECFEILGADYEDALDRLMTDKRIAKYTLKFLDEPTFSNLKESMEKEDYEQAFKHAHSFKGVCLNISFTHLFNASYDLTESLRDGKRDIELAKSLYQTVKELYEKTINVISQIETE